MKRPLYSRSQLKANRANSVLGTLLPGWALSLLLSAGPAAIAVAQTDSNAETADQEAGYALFRERVKPILEANCLSCHGTQEEAKGNLRLMSHDSLLAGGDSGAAVDLDDPDSSLLLSAINYDALEMPPKGKLRQADIDVLTEWVRRGAPYDPNVELHVEQTHSAPPMVTEEAKQFWSFRPLVRPEIPNVSNVEWITNPIDAFILSRLEKEGLSPAPPLDKAALLRRTYYDLIGLPPSPKEVDEFLNDSSPQAFEHVVDRLLNSPHYGERWARHWLDLVRYAETNSFERDAAKPHVWRYRDYVISALNNDKPYDRFIMEQLAGDELDDVTNETIIATGYYRLGAWDDEPSDVEQALYDDLDDILSTTSQVFLGLTINCARCHDHKLDPIPQTEYYRMLAFLRNVRRYGVRSEETVRDASVRSIADPEDQKVFDQQMRVYQQQITDCETKLAEIEALVTSTFSDVEIQEFMHPQNRVAIVQKRVPDVLSQNQFEIYRETARELYRLKTNRPRGLDEALCVTENGSEAPETYVLLRGNPHVPGDRVSPGFPSVLSPPEPQITPRNETSGRRRALAEWIASPTNPLTARVMMNRLWQYHFGRGIVRSSNNFGQIGDRPTHPELLDWLASEFIDRGWRLKDMHRMIVLSSAYRMSSIGNPEALAKDPENNLFWRFDMRRLSAEEIRDSILAVNGTLNLAKVGGQSFYPVLAEEVLQTQSQPGSGWGQSPPDELARRSLYIHIKRSLLTPLMVAFDAADPDSSCPVRFTTTIPTQALSMLNSDFVQREAAVFAATAQAAAGGDRREQVRFVLHRVLQREPVEAEIQRGVKLIDDMCTSDSLDPTTALANFCLVALNLNAFVYLD